MKNKIAYIAVLALAFTGCAQLTSFLASPAGKTTEKVALNILLSAAQTYANNGKFDSAWAVPVALNSVSDIVAGLDNQAAANVIQSTVTSFANDSTSRDVGRRLAAAFVSANPQTPAAKAATVTALAKGASAGLEQASPGVPLTSWKSNGELNPEHPPVLVRAFPRTYGLLTYGL